MAIKVHSTKDYSLFKPSPHNRPYDEGHVLEVMDTIKKYGFAPSGAIAVHKNGDGRFVIDEGQHRFEAAKRLGIPLWYIVDGTAIPIHERNSTMRRWNARDFVGSFCQQDNKHYVFLKSFSEHNKLPIATAASILSGTFGGATTKVRSGRFQLDNIEYANAVVEVANELVKVVKWGKSSRVLMALRLIVSVPGFNRRQMIDRISANPALLILHPNRDGFVKMFDEIYNYRTRTAERLPIAHLCASIVEQMNAARIEAFSRIRKGK